MEITVTPNTPDEELDKLTRQLVASDRDYFENLLFIKTKDRGVVRWQLNEEQLKLLGEINKQEAAGKPVRGVVLKPRRIGCSTLIEGKMFKSTTTKPYQRSMIMAHELDSSAELFEMVDLFYELLPREWKPMKRISNRRELVFDNPEAGKPRAKRGLKSQIVIDTAEKKQVGRSKLIHMLHASELAFWPYAKDTLLAVQQCVPRAKGTMIIKESTGNGVGGEFYKDYQDAKHGRTSYFCCFFPWFEHSEYRIPLTVSVEEFEDSLDREEQALIREYGVDFEQLNWRRWTVKEECRGDVEKFRQEYPSNDIEAFIVSGRMVFSGTILQEWAKQTVPPILIGDLRRAGSHVNVRENPHGYLRIWRMPQPGHQYVIGGDVAEGIDITETDYDYSVDHVYDREDLSLVASLHGHIEPDLFGDATALLGKAYNTAFIGVEANNHGLVTNKRLRDLGYPHLYYREDVESPGKRSRERRLGWYTSVRTKPTVIDGMAEHVNNGTCSIKDGDTVAEMMTFVRKPDGKMQAQDGCHDDRVMASAIGLHMHQVAGLSTVYPALRKKALDKKRRAA